MKPRAEPKTGSATTTARRSRGRPVAPRSRAQFDTVVVGGNAGYLRAVLRLLKSHHGVKLAGSAGSATEAELLLGQCRPQLVLVDARLPDASGFDLARRIRRRHPSATIVLIVAEDDAEYRKAALRAGANDVTCREDLARQLPDWIKARAGTPRVRKPRRGEKETVMPRRTAATPGVEQAWNRFRATFNQAAVGIIHTTTEGWILEVNRCLCDMLGYTSTDLRTMNTRDLTHPEDRDRQDAQRLELVAGLRPSFSSEKRYLRKDGRVIWVNRTVALGYETPDTNPYLIHTIEDITERKRAEQALQQSRARYADMVNSLDSIVWEADAATFQFTFVSQQAEKLLGYPVERWLKEPAFWQDHIHPEDRESAVAYCIEATRAQQPHDFEYRMMAADGRTVWLRDIVTVVVENGRPVRSRGVMVDITAGKRLELDARRHARARQVLAECSRALVRTTNESDLLAEMCRIIVDSTGYRQGWIGLVNDDPARPVLPVAHAGYRDDSPMAYTGVSPDGRQQGVAVTAVLTGETTVVRDILSEPVDSWRRARALKNGFQSSIALPLRGESRTLGVLVMHAPEPDAFNEEEIALLTTLAGDIGYGIMNLRAEALRHEAQRRLTRLTRARKVLAECSQVLIHARDEPRLLAAMCKIAVESGGFRQAWVAAVTEREPLRVQPAAHAGYGEDRPMAGASNWGPDGNYRGLAATAIRSGEICIARDILHDSQQSAARARAGELGYQSSIAIPLKGQTEVIGALVLHAAEGDAFDEEEVSLLGDLAGDLSYGMANLRTQHARETAERNLRESERRVREVFDQAAVGISRSDLEGVLVEVNQKFCDLLGYTREELIGRSNRDITHPDDYGAGARIREIIQGGAHVGPASSEKRYLRKDGSIFWARRTLSAAYDDAENPRYVVAVIEDISGRKLAERRFEDTFDQAPVGIAHVGLDSRLMTVNRKLCEMFGYEAGELLGKQFTDYSHPDDKGVADEPRERLLAGRNGQFQLEKRYFHRDGRVIWIRRTVSLARDDAGRPTHYISVMEDITERKLLEQQFQATFDQAAVGISHTALDGRYLRVNRKLCEITGYRQEDLTRPDSPRLSLPDDVDSGAGPRKRLLSGEIASHNNEKRYLRKDGRAIWVNRTESLARDAEGQPLYFIRVVEDVTERKELERQFRDNFEQAVVGIAHVDFNNNYIRVNSKLCEITGYTEDELTGKPASGPTHPEDVGSGNRDRALLHAGTIRSFSNEKRYIRKDGTTVWVRRTESLARDAAGKPAYCIRVIEDITERKRIEAESADLERRYRETFDQAAVGIVHTSLEGRYLKVNRRFCEMLGYDESEIVGETAERFTHPDDPNRGRDYRQQMWEGKLDKFSEEKRYVRKDGGVVWTNRTVSLARDVAGNPMYFIRVIEDITERKAVEELYRATFDNAPMGIMHTSIDGYRILRANHRLCEMLGYTREELLKMSSTDIIHPDFRFKDRKRYRDPLVEDRMQTFSSERKFLRKDGTSFWANRTISLVRDASGRPDYFIRIVEDITERKNADERVASERALLRTVVDAVPDRIYVKDREGRFLLQNLANARAHGASSPDELLGKTVFDVMPLDQARRIEAEDREILRSGTPVIERERSAVDHAGARRWVAASKVPLRDAQGRVLGVVGVNRDITGRKRMEEELRRNIERFEIAARATNDVIWDWDLVSRQIWWSGGLRTLFGYQDVSPGIESRHEGIHPADRARVMEEVQQVIDGGGKSWSGEYRFRRADGSYADVYDRGYVLHDESGRPVRMIGAMMDITERAQSARRRDMEHSVTSVLAGAPTLEAGIPRVIRAVCVSMGWAYGARWACDEASASMRRADYWADFEPEFDPADRESWLRQGGPDTSKALLSRAWALQEPVWIADFERVAAFQRGPSARKFGLRSAFAFPVVLDGQVVSLLEFFSRDARQPDEALLDVARSISGQIGQFIQRKLTDAALKESEQQFRQLAENIPQVFWITDAEQQQMLYISPAWQEITGRPLEDIRRDPRAWLDSVHAEDRTRVRQGRMAAVEGGYDENFRIVRPDGTLRWVHDRAFPVHGIDGQVYRIAGIAEDVTDRRQAETRLVQLAHYDVLTNLPNRVLFYDRLKQALAQAKRNDWTDAVLFIDVDRFKNVNDTLGHAVGDRLLQQISERLTGAVRVDDTVGRLGGDEFAMVLSNISSAKDANLVAQKILASFNDAFKLEGSEIYVSASIGITLFPDDGLDLDSLIRNADAAMYRAKELGRNNYQFYTPEMNASAQALLDMGNDLRRALDRDEFLLHFQPKASAAAGEITGVEALLRWQHPDRGLVSPAEFIPVLEETGLIVQVGEWVIRAACEQVRSWRRAGIEPVPVAINLSGRQFQSPKLGSSIVSAIEAAGIEPRFLELEITESSLMRNPEGAVSTLRFLKSYGLRISIDDFGTGYSSLGYLKRFPLDALKIDRSFVRDIGSDPDDATITRAVISMAHSLGLKVIAEGVETESQLEFLVEYGCDEIQGYLFSRPLPARDCEACLREGHRLRRQPRAPASVPVVLLVDDDEDALTLLKRSLGKDGYQILTARSAHEALDVLGGTHVDLVISDQHMPGVQGVELLQRVKRLHPGAVRLMISGDADVQEVTDAINKGEIFRFLPKGIREDKLRSDIREALQQRARGESGPHPGPAYK